MAIISIPTSIGGINIPGGIFDGPLSDLEGGDGTFFYKYPRDLESSTKSHSVHFWIEEVKEVELKTIENTVNNLIQEGADLYEDTNFGEAISGTGKTLADFAGSLWDQGTAAVEQKGFVAAARGGAQSLVSGVFNMLPKGAEIYENGSQFLREREGKIIGHIGLYMPENFELSTQISYDDNSSISTAMGSIPLLGKAVKAVTNFAEGANIEALKVGLNRAGYVFNPNKQVLFNGVEFRNFNLSFTFTPYSAAEAMQIKKIVEKFRMYASPKRNTQLDTAGTKSSMFWVPPAYFNLKFMFGGQENTNLPKIKKCIIKSIDVNYAPNGWTTHSDGAPVQTTMTIEFQETALIGRDDIKDGY